MPWERLGSAEERGEKKSVETKEEEEERRITTALRFRGMNGIDDLLRGDDLLNGVRER